MPRTSVQPSQALVVLQGGRGIPQLVTLRATAALAPALEGIAACDEALASAGRIQLAIEAGSEMAALNEANRMTVRLAAARQELLRLAGAIDGPTAPAAIKAAA